MAACLWTARSPSTAPGPAPPTEGSAHTLGLVLLRLDPDELRAVADLLARSGAELAGLAATGAGWPPSARGAVVRVSGWAEEAAGLLRHRSLLAEAGERLPWPAVALPLGAAAVAAGQGTGAAAAGAVDPAVLRARVAALEALLRTGPAHPAARARAVRAHLLRLPPAERAALAVTAPALVGGLDGAPEELRYAANHLLLQRAVAAEERREAALTPGQRAGPAGALARRRAARLRELLQPRVGADGAPAPRQWLLLDPVGLGRGVEVVGATAATGRLEEARSVAVLVPGMGSRLLPAAAGWTAASARLAGEASRLAGPGTVVVAWQGYAAPQGPDVLSACAAGPAGADLSAFVHAVAATTPAEVQLLGHSYGSLVAGSAARASAGAGHGPLPVATLTVLGSPGLGGGVVTAADLRLARGVPVYALAAPGDVVAWSGWHGDNPVEADAGTVRLATGDVAGHSAYLDEGSTSLANVALVAAGQGGAASRAPHAPDGGPLSAALADLAGGGGAVRGEGSRRTPDLDWAR